MFERELDLVKKARLMAKVGDKKMAQKEAIQMLLTNSELLEPVCYILVAVETDIMEVFPHKEYCLMMKKKAIQTNNKALLKLVKQHEDSFN